MPSPSIQQRRQRLLAWLDVAISVAMSRHIGASIFATLATFRDMTRDILERPTSKQLDWLSSYVNTHIRFMLNELYRGEQRAWVEMGRAFQLGKVIAANAAIVHRYRYCVCAPDPGGRTMSQLAAACGVLVVVVVALVVGIALRDAASNQVLAGAVMLVAGVMWVVGGAVFRVFEWIETLGQEATDD